MLKIFIRGLVFGTGFAIAMIAVSFLFGAGWVQWNIGNIEQAEHTYEETGPTFESPHKAEILPKRETALDGAANYSFFDRPKDFDGIPKGGGVLGMSVQPTPSDATRPRTYQIWLTETAMWMIRTEEATVEIEKVAYPTLKDRNPSSVVFQQLRGTGGRSSMTISASTLDMLKRGEECDDDDHLNGELRITTEGVVFLMPDEIQK